LSFIHCHPFSYHFLGVINTLIECPPTAVTYSVSPGPQEANVVNFSTIPATSPQFLQILRLESRSTIIHSGTSRRTTASIFVDLSRALACAMFLGYPSSMKPLLQSFLDSRFRKTSITMLSGTSSPLPMYLLTVLPSTVSDPAISLRMSPAAMAGMPSSERSREA